MIFAPPIANPRSRVRRSRTGLLSFNQGRVLSVIVFLCFCHLMLPLERGFRVFRVAGYLIPYALLISWVSFVALGIVSKWSLLRNWRGFYVWGQCLVSLIFFVSALRSEIPLASLAIAMQYFCIWVLNYLSLRYIMESQFRGSFVKVLCFFAFLASIVGIIEGAFSIRIPIYQMWVRAYFGEGSRLDLLEGFDRATGTLGHHHIYSTAMLLSIPFALELKKGWTRNILVLFLITASLLTVSRTVLIFLGIYLMGYLFMTRKKTWLLLPGLLLSFLMVSNIDFTQYSDSPFVSLWGQRLNLVKGAENKYADQNVIGRYDMWFRATDSFLEQNPVNEILGSGMMSSAQIAQSQNITTLDNTYITLVYEQGLAGLLTYLFIFSVFLLRFRFLAKNCLHWYAILALMIVGQTFVMTTYSTFNFISVASIAWMFSLCANKPVKWI